MPAAEAAAEAAAEPVLAYYAHLAQTAAALPAAAAAADADAAADTPPRVRVAEAHPSWEEYFGSQGPYTSGGEAGLRRVSARLADRLASLLAHPPPAAAGQTAEEVVAALLKALEASASEGAGHNELREFRALSIPRLL